jgi:hypothetical protein
LKNRRREDLGFLDQGDKLRMSRNSNTVTIFFFKVVPPQRFPVSERRLETKRILSASDPLAAIIEKNKPDSADPGDW